MKSSSFALVAALACTAAHAAPNDPSFACGGVGSDARRALAANAVGANLSLEMFVAGGGEYLADVDVAIVPADPRGVALRTRAEGPLCYARVPPGRYRVEATFEGVTRSAIATVPGAASRPVHVTLAFPKSVGDRQTDAASPEEKAQAARIP